MKDKGEKMKVVKKLVEKGKKQGALTYQEIMDELDEVDITPEQIEKIYEVLESYRSNWSNRGRARGNN